MEHSGGTILVGIGNPLLDISATVDEALLDKYGLKPDDAIMAGPEHMPLYKELMDKYKAEFIAGGSVQNSLRVAQWVLQPARDCAYFGCVGNDAYATILKEKAIADGLKVQYQVSEVAPTGTCGVLITGTHRSLCANLAAAQLFTVDHLYQEENMRIIQAAKIFYASGFFLAVSPNSILLLAEQALAHSHKFIMNLSAPFVSKCYKEPLSKLLPYTDVIVGNEMEAEAFAEDFGFATKDLQEVALSIAAMPKLNKSTERVVVITQGCNPVILVQGKNVDLIKVQQLSRDQIVDTNGAGDSFVGGFLGQMVLGKPYKTCVECGIYTASHVIQHSGCTFSGKCEFKES